MVLTYLQMIISFCHNARDRHDRRMDGQKGDSNTRSNRVRRALNTKENIYIRIILKSNRLFLDLPHLNA